MDASRLIYKPGWKFKIGGPLGRFLCIYATTPDSNDTRKIRTTQHMFELPGEDVDMARWVFDRLLDCERHEAGEYFEFDGVKPFYPNHQDEGSPYALVDRREAPC